MSGRSRARLVGVGGLVVVLAVWWIAAETAFSASGAVPTPWAVLRQFPDDGWDFYSRHVGDTLGGAAQGFLWGNAVALAIAVLVLLIPALEGVATQVAVITQCLPMVAIGPLLLVVFGGRTPSVFLAAMMVFFTTLIGALLGVRSSRRTTLDVIRAYGGGRWQQLTKVQAISALPATFAALKIAVPAALLGAIVGEYLGGVDTGVGVAMAVAQRQLEVERAWAVALLCGLLATAGYALVGLVSRWVTPWSAGQGLPGGER
ncbi:ABC transporter permease [Phytoactinopolyspora endophytica]|uniref:ABC transporter permease n=1 Tax=Phytoactinopolyspora endophytica TaxID=1642495 RepID=UPI00101DF2E8|nr:ABC transporter permease subunit [Phytoactinopolyspora endophytica]